MCAYVARGSLEPFQFPKLNVVGSSPIARSTPGVARQGLPRL